MTPTFFLSSEGMQFTDYTLNFEELKTRILKENNFSPLITGMYIVPLNKPRSEMFHLILFACLFGVNLPLDDFSLIWRRHHYRWRTSNFDLYLAFMVIEQWGFYIDKLWHCDKWYPIRMVISEDRDTHTCCRAFGSGAVTTCFYDLGLSRLGFEHLTFYIRGERSNWLRHRGGVSFEDAQECNCKNMTTPMFF